MKNNHKRISGFNYHNVKNIAIELLKTYKYEVVQPITSTILGWKIILRPTTENKYNQAILQKKRRLALCNSMSNMITSEDRKILNDWQKEGYNN